MAMAMMPVRLQEHLKRIVSSSGKRLVTSIFSSNHSPRSSVSNHHTMCSKLTQVNSSATSQFKPQLKDVFRTGVENGSKLLYSQSSACLIPGHSSLRSLTSLCQRTLNCLDSIQRHGGCHQSVIMSLSRGFRTKQRFPLDEEDDVEVDQKREQKDQMDDYSSWMLRMSNENNYLSWCRNIYISTLVAYTTAILAPGHFTAEGVFIVVAFANLFFGTLSFIYHTIRMRRKMKMSIIGVMYNVLLAVIHFIIYVTCISMYSPFNVEFIEDDENDVDDI